jgi:hypothetical protein
MEAAFNAGLPSSFLWYSLITFAGRFPASLEKRNPEKPLSTEKIGE